MADAVTADDIGRGDVPTVAQAAGLDAVFAADDLSMLRAAVTSHAARFGVPEPGLGRLLVVATELATNAIRHGGGCGRLRLWRQGDAIYCEVSDDGPGIADTGGAGTRQVPLSDEGGRGLLVVRQFADEVRITPRDPGTAVTVTLRM
jgi:anti-sigma regulatory factor (Ser/Thr protein kinase)